MADAGYLKPIGIDYLELDLENHRHGKLKTPEEAMTYLIEKEKVLELAIDIAREGTNPMDLMGVVVRKKTSESPVYTSMEGNRRLCAFKILHDPQSVPSGVTKRTQIIDALEQVTKKHVLPQTINCIVFKSRTSAKPWIDRMHLADQDGRARRRWRPDQQTRAAGGGRNVLGLQVLDVAEQLGKVAPKDRNEKLTTVQRYIGNPDLRAEFGLEADRSKKLSVTRDPKDFERILDRFTTDIRDGALSSRSNAAEIAA